jgi:hypothetical protein
MYANVYVDARAASREVDERNSSVRVRKNTRDYKIVSTNIL